MAETIFAGPTTFWFSMSSGPTTRRAIYSETTVTPARPSRQHYHRTLFPMSSPPRALSQHMFSFSCLKEFPYRWLNFLKNLGQIWNRKSFIKQLETGSHYPTCCQTVGFLLIYLHANSYGNPNMVRRVIAAKLCRVELAGQLFTGSSIRKLW